MKNDVNNKEFSAVVQVLTSSLFLVYDLSDRCHFGVTKVIKKENRQKANQDGIN